MRDNTKGGALTEVTFFILLSLYTPKHGYAIMQFIENETKGRLILGAGTLYGALNTLQEKCWIMPCGISDGRKKEYEITEEGKDSGIRTFSEASEDALYTGTIETKESIDYELYIWLDEKSEVNLYNKSYLFKIQIEAGK